MYYIYCDFLQNIFRIFESVHFIIGGIDMLKVVQSIDFSTVEIWKEEELLNLSQTVIFLPIEAIKTIPSIGEIPYELFEKLEIKILKISFNDKSENLLVRSVEELHPHRGYFRINLCVESVEFLRIKSAIERTIAAIFFNISGDFQADFFHSSGEVFHRVDFYGKLGNQILKMNISEEDLQKAQEIVDVIRQRRATLKS